MYKSFYIFVFCLIITQASYCQSVPNYKLDKKRGFREFKLGDDISKYPGLILKKTEVRQQVYVYSKENLNLNGGSLEKIEYIFFKHKLSNIIITASTYLDADQILALFESLYGKQETWKGNTVSMIYNEKEHRFIISDNQLSRAGFLDKLNSGFYVQ